MNCNSISRPIAYGNIAFWLGFKIYFIFLYLFLHEEKKLIKLNPINGFVLSEELIMKIYLILLKKLYLRCIQVFLTIFEVTFNLIFNLLI